ncbi:hypothetical protein ABIA03_002127 [Bradyrhizobium yuanmingense]
MSRWKIDQAGRGGDAHVDAGMLLLEIGQPRQQPFGGERGQRRHCQHLVVVLAQETVGGEAQIVEGGADARQIVARLRRQRQRAVLPDEQADAEFLLQPADLMADRGLGHVQFAGCQREAEVARGGLERPQSVQGGQSGSHLAAGCMTLFHAKRYKLSFVAAQQKADISGQLSSRS